MWILTSLGAVIPRVNALCGATRSTREVVVRVCFVCVILGMSTSILLDAVESANGDWCHIYRCWKEPAYRNNPTHSCPIKYACVSIASHPQSLIPGAHRIANTPLLTARLRFANASHPPFLVQSYNICTALIEGHGAESRKGPYSCIWKTEGVLAISSVLRRAGPAVWDLGIERTGYATVRRVPEAVFK
jgi:hypothetical protein